MISTIVAEEDDGSTFSANLNKPSLGIYTTGTEVTLTFDPERASAADSEFDGNRAKLVAARLKENTSVPRSLAEAKSVLANNSSAEYTLEVNRTMDFQDYGSWTGEKFNFTPQESGQYVLFLTTPGGSGTGIEAQNGNLTLSGNSTIIGFDIVSVQSESSSVSHDDVVQAGHNATFNISSTGAFSSDEVNHIVVLYDNQTLANTENTFTFTNLSTSRNVSISTEIAGINGIQRVQGNPKAFGMDLPNRSISAPFDPVSLAELVANQTSNRTNTTIQDDARILNGSITVIRANSSAQVKVGIPSNWPEGTYRWMHIASANNGSTMVSNVGGINVRQGPKEVPLSIDADPSTVLSGEAVNFTVTRTDTGETVNARITVNGETFTTGPDGTYTYNFANAGEYTVTAAKNDTSTVDFQNASTSVTVNEPANVGISGFTLSSSNITTDDSVTVSATVENTGDVSGSTTVQLQIDGSVVASRTVTVNGNSQTTIQFTRSFDAPGTYAVGFEGSGLGTKDVQVRSPAEANLSVDSFSLSSSTIGAGQSITVSATVENTGDLQGTEVFNLTVNGSVVASQEVTVDEQSTQTITFSRTFNQTGTYDIAVGELPATTVTVVEPSNITVTSFTLPSNGTVEAGNSVSINATVTNTGGTQGRITVVIYVDGSQVAQQRVTVGAGESKTVTFSETFDEPGAVDIRVNDQPTKELLVEGAAFNYTDLQVSPTGPHQEGDSVTVTTTVVNDGNVAGETTATLTVNGTQVATQTVFLDAGESTTVSFNHTLSQAGTYDVSISDLTTSITVERASPANVTYGYVQVPDSIVQGEPPTVITLVENTGGSAGNYSLTLYLNGTAVETREGTIGAGESTQVTFTPNVSGYDGTVSVRVNELPTRSVEIVKPASVTLAGLVIGPQPARVNETVTVRALVENTGDQATTTSVDLRVDGEVISTKSVSIAGNSAKRVSFQTTFSEPGTYEVTVGNLTAETVNVLEPAQISYSNLNIPTDSVDVGGVVTITAQVRNTGEVDGTYTANLTVDGTVVQQKGGVIGAGETIRVRFQRTFVELGDHNLTINGLPNQTLTVEPIDTVAPGAKLRSPSQGRVAYGTPINLTVVDNGNLSSVWYELETGDGTITENVSVPAGSDSIPVTIQTDSIREGQATLTVHAVDEAGNTLAKRFRFDFVSQPKITSVAPTGVAGGTVSLQVAYRDNRVDGDTGVNASAVRLYLNGDLVSTQANATSVLVNVEPLESGTHTARVEVVDEAGHQNQRTWEFTVDRSAPTTSIAASPSDQVRSGREIGLKAGANDPNLANATVRILSPDGNAVYERNITSAATLTSGTINLQWTGTASGQPVQSGNYTVEVVATDSFAQTNRSTTTVTIDNDAPNLTSVDVRTESDTGTDGTIVANGSETLTIIADAPDTLSGTASVSFEIEIPGTTVSRTVKASRNDGVWRATVDVSTLPTDGIYVVSGTAVDAAGNRVSVTGETEIVVDTRGPRLGTTITRDGSQGRVTVTTLGEAVQGTPTVEVERPDGSTVTVELTATDDGYTGTFDLVGSGTYVAQATATDAAGNVGTAQAESSMTVIDQQTTQVTVYLEDSGIFVRFQTEDPVNNTFFTLSSSEISSRPLQANMDGISFLNGQIGEELNVSMTGESQIGFPARRSGIPSPYWEQVDIVLHQSGDDWKRVDTRLNRDMTLTDGSGNVIIDGEPYWVANISHFSYYGAVATDTDGPSITYDSPESSTLSAGTDSVWVNATLNDSISGVNASSITVLKNGEDVTDQATTTDTGVAYQLASLSAGESHNITVIVEDEAGNKNQSSMQVSVESDTTAPSVSVDSPSEGQTFTAGTDSVQLSASLSDTDTSINIASVSVMIDGKDITAGSTVTESSVSSTLTGLEPGSHTLTITVEDAAGNQQRKTVNFSIGEDTAAPTIDITSPVNRTYANTTSSVTVDVNVTDSSRIAAGDVTVIVNGLSVDADTTDPSAISYTMTELSPGSSHNVTVIATDSNGYTARKTVHFDIASDDTGPSISVTPKDEAVLPSTSQTVNVTVSLSDAASGVDSSTISALFDGQSLRRSANVTNVQVNESAVTFTATGLSTGSSHSVIVNVRDDAGNLATKTTTFSINTQATVGFTEVPSLSSSVVGTGETVTVNATLKNFGEEQTSVTRTMFVNGAAVQTKSITLGPGERRTIQFTTSFDSTGQYSLRINQTTVGTVEVAPSYLVTSVSVAPKSVSTDGTVTVNATVQNLRSEANSITLVLADGGTEIATKTVEVAGESSKQVSFQVTLSSAGTHTLTVNGQTVGKVTVQQSTSDTDQSGQTTTPSVSADVVPMDGKTTVVVHDAQIGSQVNVSLPNVSSDQAAVVGMNISMMFDAGNFRVEFTPPQTSPPQGVPPVDSETTRGIAYFTGTAHNVEDSQIEKVTFTFTVAESALPDGATPADVVLYRYTDGSWQTLETTHLKGETYRATAAGFTAYAIGVTQEATATPTDTPTETPTDTPTETPTTTETPVPPTDESPSGQDTEPETPTRYLQGGGLGTTILIVLVIALLVGAAYWLRRRD